MSRVPTPIPKSVASFLADVKDGSIVDVIWKLIVVSVFIFVILVLSTSFGFLGILAAFAIFGALLGKGISAAVLDIWNREFWSWKL